MDTTTMQQNTLVEHIRLSRTATPAKVVNPHSTLTRMFLLPTVTSAHHKKQENDPSQQDKADPPKCATLIPYAVRSHLPHMRASDMFGTGNFCGGSWERSVWESRLRHKPGTKSVYASPPDVILVQHSDPARLAEELSALLCVGPHPGIVSCLACVSATTLVLERAPLGSLAALAPHLANECTLLHTNCMLLQVCAALTKITKAGWVLRNISWQHVLLFVFDPQSPRECVVKLSNFSAAVRGGASQHRNRTIGWQKGFLRTSAPELLRDKEVSEKTDVWAFGIMAFQHWTHCETLYKGYPDSLILPVVVEERLTLRLPPATGSWSGFLRGVIRSCWEYAADDRPTFAQLVDLFEHRVASLSTSGAGARANMSRTSKTPDPCGAAAHNETTAVQCATAPVAPKMLTQPPAVQTTASLQPSAVQHEATLSKSADEASMGECAGVATAGARGPSLRGKIAHLFRRGRVSSRPLYETTTHGTNDAPSSAQRKRADTKGKSADLRAASTMAPPGARGVRAQQAQRLRRRQSRAPRVSVHPSQTASSTDTDCSESEDSSHEGALRSVDNLLRFFCLSANDISWNCSNQLCGDDTIRELTGELENNTTVRQLHFSCNRIQDDGAVALACLLKRNSTITHLFLNENHIGQVGARALADALMVNTSLLVLSLCHNNLGTRGCLALMEALQHNTTVRQLHIGHNGVDRKDMNTLFFARTRVAPRAPHKAQVLTQHAQPRDRVQWGRCEC
eukprot:m.919151 g.919151  ORF g.919151 m.919151 type:complete len:739 (+) comp23749_c0_seq11:535-2751(+)